MCVTSYSYRERERYYLFIVILFSCGKSKYQKYNQKKTLTRVQKIIHGNITTKNKNYISYNNI